MRDDRDRIERLERAVREHDSQLAPIFSRIGDSSGVDGAGGGITVLIDFTLSGTTYKVPQAGLLTTRGSATAGTLTMDDPTGHEVETGETLDLIWNGTGGVGTRQGVTIGTVSGDQVPFTGGTGGDLPVEDDPDDSRITVAPIRIAPEVLSLKLLARQTDGEYRPTRAADQVGTLTERVSDTAGTITLGTGHGILAGERPFIWWGDFSNYRNKVTVASVTSTTITIEGGTGDNLPADESAVVVTHYEVETVEFRYTAAQSMVTNRAYIANVTKDNDEIYRLESRDCSMLSPSLDIDEAEVALLPPLPPLEPLA